MLLFSLLKPSDSNESSGIETEDPSANFSVETVYVTSPDSEDPEGDYQKYLESKKENAKTSEEALRATLDQVTLAITQANYDEAKSLLDAVDLSAHSSHKELFQFYNVYSRLYADYALNDPELYLEYTNKANEERNLLILEEAEEAEGAEKTEKDEEASEN